MAPSKSILTIIIVNGSVAMQFHDYICMRKTIINLTLGAVIIPSFRDPPLLLRSKDPIWKILDQHWAKTYSYLAIIRNKLHASVTLLTAAIFDYFIRVTFNILTVLIKYFDF